MTGAAIIGGGPAGLMAAQALLDAGIPTTVYEAKPSLARKFLMAGKSGLNITKADVDILPAYTDRAPHLAPMLNAFGPDDITRFMDDLGIAWFTGSTGRVFPTAMKASPLLRAWLARLTGKGLQVRTRWRWTGWDGGYLRFNTPDGTERVQPLVTVLALGGSSWARLGSDGLWANTLGDAGVTLAPFQPSNSGLRRVWSVHMAPVFGQPLKAIRLTAGDQTSRGEIVISARGIEGGGLYPLTPALRQGAPLTIDLLPDLSPAEIAGRLSRPRGKASHSMFLRKTLKLDAPRMALLNELARPLPQAPQALAHVVKHLTITDTTLAPMDEAISTAGGVSFDAVTNGLMLKALPGTFVAGEMLDWEAPTGGYLLTACMATGQWAGRHAAAYAAAAR